MLQFLFYAILKCHTIRSRGCDQGPLTVKKTHRLNTSRKVFHMCCLVTSPHLVLDAVCLQDERSHIWRWSDLFLSGCCSCRVTWSPSEMRHINLLQVSFCFSQPREWVIYCSVSKPMRSNRTSKKTFNHKCSVWGIRLQMEETDRDIDI